MGRMKDQVIEYEEYVRFMKKPTAEQLSYYDVMMNSVKGRSSKLSVIVKRKLLKKIAESID